MKIQSAEEFHNATQKGISLIDFHVAACPPCRAQESPLRELEERYDGKATIAELDVDEHVDIATNLGIQSVPTLILFKNGREIRRFIGMHGRKFLSRVVDEALGTEKESRSGG